MSVYTKDNFPEIISRPHWGLTWTLRVVCSMVFGLLILLIYFIPTAFYIDGTMDADVFIFFSAIYYPVMIYLSYRGVRYLKSVGGKAVIRISVNHKGIFYLKRNGSVTSLRYQQLEWASKGIVFDVFAQTDTTWQYGPGPTALKCFFGGKEFTVHFRITDLFYSYYTGNSRILRQHFIQGVAVFRPELRIAPNVYANFYIEPKTFAFDKRKYLKTVLIVVILLLLFILAMEWYMWYRFDGSFIF